MALTNISNMIANSQNISEEIKEILHVLTSYVENVFTKNEGVITDLKDKVCKLENKVESLESKLDEREQHERKETLILSGQQVPDGKKNEDCKMIISELIKTHTKLILKPEDITLAHRIGPKQDGSDKRRISFKMRNQELVQTLLKTCKDNKPPFYVNASLTPTRNKIAYLLRRAKRKFPGKISKCSTFGGNVAVFMKEDNIQTRSKNNAPAKADKKLVINTWSALEDFAVKILKTTAEELQST